jgi:hypothetical protein
MTRKRNTEVINDETDSEATGATTDTREQNNSDATGRSDDSGNVDAAPAGETGNETQENYEEEIKKILSPYKEIGGTPKEEKGKRGRKPKSATTAAAPPPTAFKIPGKVWLTLHSRGGVTLAQLLDSVTGKGDFPAEMMALPKEVLEDPDMIYLAEECVKAMKMEENPITAFYGSMLGIWIGNYFTIRAMMQAEKNGNR